MSLHLRPGQALKLWHDSVLDLVHLDESGLTVRQLSILLTVYLELPPHTVRGVAQKLKVTKPVITRALDSLGRLELVARRRDPADKRTVLIQRTVKGALFVEKLGDFMVNRAQMLPS